MLIKVNGLEYCELEFSYNHDIIEFIKNKVPASYRQYNSQTNNWKIHQHFLPVFIDYLELKNIAYKIDVNENIKPYYEHQQSIFDFTDIKTGLYKHQKTGVHFAMTHKNFVIGDDQGLGKTLELLAFATSLKKKGAKHCLIICGVAGNVWNWENEIKKHTNEKSYILGRKNNGNIGSGKDKFDSLHYPHEEFFYITNKETLRLLHKREGRRHIYPMVDIINKLVEFGEISLIAVDECHKIKNPESSEGRALLRLNCPRKALMSGTIVMNNPLDLYMPLQWCGVIDQDYYHFKQDYCKFGGYGGTEIVGYKNTDKLKGLLSPIFIRRLKEEELELPPKIMIDEYIKLDDKQWIGYKHIENYVQKDIHKITFSDNPLSIMIHMREYLDDPSLVELPTYDLSKIESPKYSRLIELLDNIFDNENAQVIVYSQWSRVTNKIRDMLSKIYGDVSYCDGNIYGEARMKEQDKFQEGKTKIIVGTIGALGTGFTLNRATDVIFIDEPWNMAIKNQAIDRAHRIGTKYPVNVHTLICKDTIDERIHDLILKKSKMADDLIITDDPKLTNDEIKYLCGMQ